jgi:hypothetical protein
MPPTTPRTIQRVLVDDASPDGTLLMGHLPSSTKSIEVGVMVHRMRMTDN